jgi:hypothetical protein
MRDNPAVPATTDSTGRRVPARLRAATLLFLALAASISLVRTAGAQRGPDAQSASGGQPGGFPDPLGLGRLDAGFGQKRRPTLGGALPASVKFRLESAYSLAFRKLAEEAACRALFHELGAAGEEVLSRARYADGGGSLACAGETRAVTCVGCLQVRLCPAFAGLEVSAAALIVLHEGLHVAGLAESPAYLNAPNARQINDMVAQGCRLR